MKFCVSLLFLAFLTSCSTSPEGALSYEIDSSRYRKLSPQTSKIKVSLWDQKAWLLNENDEAVLVTDIATGVPGKETPQGHFEVLERLETKRSNRYGKYVDETTGKVVVEKSWEHEGSPPEGTVIKASLCLTGCASLGMAWACT